MIEARDPVCLMAVDTNKPPAKLEYRGTTYYFCSHACLQTFQKDPGRYVDAQPPGAASSSGESE